MKKIYFWIPEGYAKTFEDSLSGENPDNRIRAFAEKVLREHAITAKSAIDRGYIPDRGMAGPEIPISEEILNRIVTTYNNDIKDSPPRAGNILYNINLGGFVYEYLDYFIKIGGLLSSNVKNAKFEDMIQDILTDAFSTEIQRLNEAFFAQKERKTNKKAQSKKKQ